MFLVIEKYGGAEAFIEIYGPRTKTKNELDFKTS